MFSKDPEIENTARYKKINAFTKAPSFAMILAILLIIGLIVLHALIINSIFIINNSILIFLLAFNYLTLVFMVFDYFILLTIDPADPRLLSS